MANETVIIIPQSGVNVIEAPQTAVHYIHGDPRSQQELNLHQGPLRKILKSEFKTLGAIQILIALLHIGFGTISAVAYKSPYILFGLLLGYPYWGGIFFIISGSLSVSAENHLRSGLVKCSVGMNITSAVMASIGIILFIAELVVNQLKLEPHFSEPQVAFKLSKSVETGIAVLLLLFSFLEFAITVTLAHFGCQATCCNTDPDIMPLVSNEVSGSMADSAESNLLLPPPPEYHSVDSLSKAE